MMQHIMIVFLAIIFSSNIQAQSQPEFEIVRDSIIHRLSIEKNVADSLVSGLFNIEEQKLNTLSDTVLTYQQNHEKRLLLAIEREAVLKKWLSAEKYQLWKKVYRGRPDPVMLAWKRTASGKIKVQ